MQKQSFLFPWGSKWPPRDKATSQGLFPGLGAGRGAPPPSQGKDPGNEVGDKGLLKMIMIPVLLEKGR